MKTGKRKSALKARQVVLEAVRKSTHRKPVAKLAASRKKPTATASKNTKITKKTSPVDAKTVKRVIGKVVAVPKTVKSEEASSPKKVHSKSTEVTKKVPSKDSEITKQVPQKDIEVSRRFVISPISTRLDLRHTILPGKSSPSPLKQTAPKSQVFTRVGKEKNSSALEKDEAKPAVSISSRRIASAAAKEKTKPKSKELSSGQLQSPAVSSLRSSKRKMSSSGAQDADQNQHDTTEMTKGEDTKEVVVTMVKAEETVPEADEKKTEPEEQGSEEPDAPKEHQDPPSSPKKLKGSLAVKFKSWNWTKQDQIQRSKENLDEEPFESSDEEKDEQEVDDDKNPVVVEQNNQRLYKCQKCLLYIPQENFNYHEMESCEALHTSHGCEYTCSECLATYPSQKLLVRHKRECPKRSQSMYRNKSPRDGRGLEGMYSVVWKCHCKESFKSSEDLEKHRSKCKFAQNYTVPCPICNLRIMGGHRTLRYHMSKNHPSLFLPDESSTSCILNSLQNNSPSQVITTQTANIDKLVKQLSKEHSGASIRIVTVPKDDAKTPTKDNKGSVESHPVLANKSTPAPTSSITKSAPSSSTPEAHTEEEPLYDLPGVDQEDNDVDMKEITNDAIKTRQAGRGATNLPSPAVKKAEVIEPADTSEATSAPDDGDVKEEVSDSATKRKPSTRRSVSSSSATTPVTVRSAQGKQAEAQGKEAAVEKSAIADTEEEPPTKRLRVSQRNKEKDEAKQKAAETTESKMPKKISTTTKVAEAKSTTPTATKVSQSKTVEKPSKENTETKENRDDLQNLLQKARALTKELEQKLAQSESVPEKEEDTQESTEEGDQEAATERQEEQDEKPVLTKKQTTKRKSTSSASKAPVAKRGRSKTEPSLKGKKDEGTPESGHIKPGGRFSQVTCLDCFTVLKDHMELGSHKRFHCKGKTSDFGLDDVEVCVGGNEKQKMDASECYYCTMCKSKFSLRSQLYTHMRDYHKYEGLHRYLNFHCPYCPRVFQTMKLRQAHKMDRHHDIMKSTTVHEEEYFVQGQETCGKCFAIFPKSELLMHDEKCQENIDQQESGSFCQLCGLVMEDAEELKVHRQQTHLTAIHFRCGQCSRTFGHALELRCHKVSHHSRSQKMDHVYREVRRLETQRKIKLGKSIKIHISPAIPVKDESSSKIESVSLPKKNLENVQLMKTPITVKSEKVKKTVSMKIPAPSRTSTPVSDKIVKTGKGPLSLSKEQMALLSKGKSIKLVLPKDTDMKRLSFAVPSKDGKTKKFSLSPKPEPGSGQSGSVDGGEEESGSLNGQVADDARPEDEQDMGRISPQPQRELAAALGLQPADPNNPVKAAKKHRPTRLRSGRTIENAPQASPPPKKEKEDGAKTSKETAKKTPDENDAPAEGDNKPDEVVTEETETTDVETDIGPDGNNEESPVKEQAIAEDTQPTEASNTDVNTTKKNRDSASLPPVQVLKPLGNDRVQCMRCNRILASMMEVANHQCDFEQAETPPVPDMSVKLEPSGK